VVQGFAPSLGGRDGDNQIFLDGMLPYEIIQTPGPQAGFNWPILGAGFT